MTGKKKRNDLAEVEFGEALERLIQTDPDELATEIQKGKRAAERQEKRVKKEIKDGARPKRGKFRL